MNKKKWLIGAAAVVFILLCVILLFFQGKKSSATELKVGLVLTGLRTEGGWNQAHYEAMSEACNQQSAELIVKESIAEGTGECIPAIDELAAAGVKLIFLPGYAYGKEVAEYADTYPDIAFYQIDGTYVGANVSSYFGRMYQARYLAGVVAANRSETGKIGYVAAIKTPEVLRGLNAFTLGVRSVNENANVYVKWVGNWDDEDAEKQLATELIEEENVDVLTYHQNKTYVIDIAEQYEIDSIGYHTDASEQYSDHYLTAAVWNFTAFYQDRIRDYMTTGKSEARSYWDGVNDGIVGLAPYSDYVGDEIRQQIIEVMDKFNEGQDVFCGPIYDTEGVLRVDEGEQLSDEYLQTALDWMVQGVVE